MTFNDDAAMEIIGRKAACLQHLEKISNHLNKTEDGPATWGIAADLGRLEEVLREALGGPE